MKAVYGDDFYRGMPALTVNKFGAGEAWYLATSPDAEFLKDWLSQLCSSRGIEPNIHSVPEGVETTLRSKDGEEYLFVLNHNEDAVTIELGIKSGVDLLTDRQLDGGKAELAGRDLWIIKLHS
ncbi:Beta-galactosidase BgaA [compost metagenome]